MAVQDKKEDRKGISPAVIIIPLGLGLGAVAVLGIAAMAMAATPTPPPGRANLYGKVTDADSGAPAAGALITLDSMTTYSDDGGNYTFTDIDPGVYNITVEHTDHNTFSQSVTLAEGMTQLNVQLVPVAAPPAAADIRVESLTISPTQVTVEDKVIISATATNYGSASGSKTITLSVDGTTSSQTVTLAPSHSQQINFEVTPHEAKTYNVSVDGLAGSFTAIAPVAPPFTMSITRLEWAINEYVPASWGIVQITALIVNNNSVPVTHGLRCMHCRPGQQDENSVASYSPYPRRWNGGTILTLTLQPGASAIVVSPFYCYDPLYTEGGMSLHSGERIRYAWRIFDELNNMSPSAYYGTYP